MEQIMSETTITVVALLCLAAVYIFSLVVKQGINKRKLAECKETIRKLEFSLDEASRVLEAQNNQISVLNRKLKESRLITTIEDLNKAQDEQRTIL